MATVITKDDISEEDVREIEALLAGDGGKKLPPAAASVLRELVERRRSGGVTIVSDGGGEVSIADAMTILGFSAELVQVFVDNGTIAATSTRGEQRLATGDVLALKRREDALEEMRILSHELGFPE